MPRLSANAALLVLVGLMSCLWVLLAVEVALQQVSVVTVVMAVGFTIVVALWPFLNGVRFSQQGARQLIACWECQQFIPAAQSFGFCVRCGAFLTPPTKVGLPSGSPA
jgi:hypothetical protein